MISKIVYLIHLVPKYLLRRRELRAEGWMLFDMRKWPSPLKWEWYRRENDVAMSRQPAPTIRLPKPGL